MATDYSQAHDCFESGTTCFTNCEVPACFGVPAEWSIKTLHDIMDDGFAIYKSLQRTDDDGSMKLHVDDGKRFGNKIGEVHFKFATHAYGAAIDHVPITDGSFC